MYNHRDLPAMQLHTMVRHHRYIKFWQPRQYKGQSVLVVPIVRYGTVEITDHANCNAEPTVTVLWGTRLCGMLHLNRVLYQPIPHTPLKVKNSGAADLDEYEYIEVS